MYNCGSPSFIRFINNHYFSRILHFVGWQCNVADDKGALDVVKGNDVVLTIEMYKLR